MIQIDQTWNLSKCLRNHQLTTALISLFVLEWYLLKGLCHAICLSLKRKKVYSHQLNSKNNGLVLLLSYLPALKLGVVCCCGWSLQGWKWIETWKNWANFFQILMLHLQKSPPKKERLNGVDRQPSNGQKFYRQPSKKGKFYRQPSKKQLLLGVKRFISFSCLSRTAGSQRIVLTGTTSFHVPKYTNFTVFSLIRF